MIGPIPIELIVQLADSPGAVAKLREFVLRLAFAGRLSDGQGIARSPSDQWKTYTVGEIADSITPGFACSRSHQKEDGHVHLRTHNVSTLGTLNYDLFVRIDLKMVDPQKASIWRGDILFNNTDTGPCRTVRAVPTNSIQIA